MKKEYKKPAITVVKLDAEQILAGSTVGMFGESTDYPTGEGGTLDEYPFGNQ